MISRELSDALNSQVNAEIWSSNLYMAMAIYFQKEGYTGFSHWMRKQGEEELSHAYKIADYSVERGGNVVIDHVNVVPNGWGNALEVFEHSYNHECHVSEMINRLVDIAEKDKDHASRAFLFYFVNEQIEEEAMVKELVEKIKRFGNSYLGILDHQLSKR